MINPLSQVQNRRAFLKFLAASPLCSVAPGLSHDVDEEGEIITGPADALDVFDFKASAREKLPPAHYGYIATGTLDDRTLHANREAFEHYYLRSRRLIDVSGTDTSVNIFGEKWPTPIALCPTGHQRAFHNQGELATARAARSRNHLQILSTVSSYSVEEVTAARGAPVWYQLYTFGGWDGVRQMLARAEASGSPVLVVTVDLPAGAPLRNTLERWKRLDSRDCGTCHSGNGIAAGPGPMLTGPPTGRMPLTWDFLRRLRETNRSTGRHHPLLLHRCRQASARPVCPLAEHWCPGTRPQAHDRTTSLFPLRVPCQRRGIPSTRADRHSRAPGISVLPRRNVEKEFGVPAPNRRTTERSRSDNRVVAFAC